MRRRGNRPIASDADYAPISKRWDKQTVFDFAARTEKTRETRMLEKVVEAKVREYALQKGFIVYKFTSPSHRCVPDRIFIAPSGVLAFIEFKRPGGKVSAGQIIELKRLERQLQIIKVIDSIQAGKDFVDALLTL